MPVSIDIEVVPRGLVYFVDAGSMINPADGRKPVGSRAYNSVAALVGTGVGGLYNTAADQQKATSNTWGYTTTVGSSTGNMTASINESLTYYIVPNYTDKINYGWFGRSQNSASLASMNYTLTFETPGEYILTFGVKDWWPPNGKTQDRQYAVTISNASGTIATGSYGLFSQAGQGPEAVETLTFKIAAAGTYTFSLANRVGEGTDDPVLAWFAIARAPGFYVLPTQTSKTASTLTAGIMLQNFTGESKTVAVYVAVYNNGKLVGLTSTDVFELGVNSAWTGTLQVAGLAFGPGYTAKAFAWDDAFVPLCNAADIDLG